MYRRKRRVAYQKQSPTLTDIQVYGISNYLPVIFTSLGVTGDKPLILYGKYEKELYGPTQ